MTESYAAIEIRDRHFAFDTEVPKHWHPGGKALTTFFDGLSLYFPAGERFFIKSVQRFAHFVQDPALKEAVRAFCQQEALHTREHLHYNTLLERQGYPARKIEQRVERILRFFSHTIPARWQLSATCALEHYTALMGRFILRDERLLRNANPVMRELWLWHAREENEHRSVAFDVYVAAGGGRLERSFIMVMTTLIFWTLVVVQQAEMMHTDGTHFSLSEWRALLRFLVVEPGGFGRLPAAVADYMRTDFHPDNTRL